MADNPDPAARLAHLRQILLDAGLGPRQTEAWLHSPTGWLSGEVPAELVARNDEHSQQRALRAATRKAAQIFTDDESAQRNLAAFRAAMEDRSAQEP